MEIFSIKLIFHLLFIALTVQNVKSAQPNMPKILAFNRRFLLASKNYIYIANRKVPFITPNVNISIKDYAPGTGRQDKSKEQCQSQKDGGAAAVLGDTCNYTKWRYIRRPVLYTFSNGNDLKFEAAVQRQTATYEASKNLSDFYKFFKDFCIQCTRDPLLECDQKTQKCVCWRKYVQQGKGNTSQERCRTKLGDICDEFSGAKCVNNGYCNQGFTCECLENGISCDKNSSELSYTTFQSYKIWLISILALFMISVITR